MAGSTTKDKDVLGRSGMLRRIAVAINALVNDVETLRGGAAGLVGSATYDPPNLTTGSGATTTVTVTGCALGDFVTACSFSLDLQGITVTAYVSAANTVSVRFQNQTGGTLDLASGTLRVRTSAFGTFTGAASDMTAAKIGGPSGTALTA